MTDGTRMRSFAAIFRRLKLMPTRNGQRRPDAAAERAAVESHYDEARAVWDLLPAWVRERAWVLTSLERAA